MCEYDMAAVATQSQLHYLQEAMDRRVEEGEMEMRRRGTRDAPSSVRGSLGALLHQRAGRAGLVAGRRNSISLAY